MTTSSLTIGRRVRELRGRFGISQETAADELEISQPTYSRIETGERALKGAELVALADLMGVRAGAITGYARFDERAQFSARTNGDASNMIGMRERLCAYLELDAYLTEQGFPPAQ